MAVRRVQLRRGTSAQNNAFTGAVGEITVDTDRNSIRVHDGNTAGGTETARSDLSNIDFAANSTVSFLDSAGGTTVKLTGVADPANPQDVATKAYVDSAGASEILLSELGDTDLNDTVAYADGQIMLYDAGSGKWWNRAMSGDATITDLGEVTLTADSVVTTNITNANVTNAKLANPYVTITDGTISDNLPLGQTLTFSNTANETTVAVSADAGAGADGVVVTIGLPNDVTIGQDLTITRDLGVGRHLTVTGNLTVNGTTTTINSTTVSTAERVIELNNGIGAGTSNTNDLGLFLNRGGDDDALLLWDEGENASAGSFVLATHSGAVDGTTSDFSSVAGMAYAPLKISALTATSSILATGDMTLKADNATLAVQTAAGVNKFTIDSDDGATYIAGIVTLDDNLSVKSSPTTAAIIINSELTGAGEEADASIISVKRGQLGASNISWSEGSDKFSVTHELQGVSGLSVGANLGAPTATIASNGDISTSTSVSVGTSLSVGTTTTLTGDATIEADASLFIEAATASTDHLIVLNKNVDGVGGSPAAQDAFISVRRGAALYATVQWDESETEWVTSNKFKSTGTLTAGADLVVTTTALINGTSTLKGNVTLNGASLTIDDGEDPAVNKFTVASDTGNTSVAGTLSVTGLSTLATGSSIGNLTLANGSITDSSGGISFDNENLSTTGTLSAGSTTVTSLSVSEGNVTNVGNIALDSISADETNIAINLTGGSATALTISEVGADAGVYMTFNTDGNTIAFGKVFSAVTNSTIGNLTLGNGSITDSSGSISFGDENLSTTGTLSVTGATGLGSTLTINNAGGTADLVVQNNGVSKFVVDGTAGDTTTSGTMSVGSTLTVTGKTTLDDTLNLKYTDGLTTPLILANSDLTGEGEEASAILIEVERGTAPNVRIQWNEASDVFEVEGVLSSKSGFQVGTDATAPKVAISTGGVLSFTDASQGAILFNSDLAGGANPENTDDFGITVNRGVLTDAKLYWDESATRWQFETGNVAIQNSLVVDSDAGAGGGVITISAGQITSDSGTLSLNTNVLATTGSVNISNNELILDSDNGNNRATITSSLGTIWFDNENLTTSGNISTTGTGALSVAGTSTLFGGVTLNGANLTINNGLDPLVNKFTVVASSGNTNIEGTLVVKSTTTLHNTLVANADSAVDLGTNAVRWRDIYSDGLTLTDNASIGGTLGVTGISTLTGLLNANGGIAVDGTAFTVADTTGNVVTEGTLVVKSTTELDGNVSIKNGFGGATTFAVTAASGNTSISGTLGVAKTTTINSADGSADFIVQNNGVSKFVVDGEAGNTTTQGTMTIVGNTEVTTGNLTVTQGNLVVTAGGLTLTAGGVSATAAASSFGAVSATSFSQSGATLTLVSGGGAATDAFVSVERGATDAQIKWNETSDKWQVRDVSDGTFYNIVDTNTTLFSLNAGGNNKNFILSDGADTLTISGSGGVSVAHAGNGTVALSLSDSISITSDLTVGGTATFNGATMRLVDTLLYMGLNNASTANNIGFYGQYKTVGDVTQYAGLAYRPLSDKFVLFGSETGLSSTEVSIAPTDSELTSLDLKTLVAVSGVSVKSSSDDTSAKTALLLNSDQTGTPAATEDVSIEVERGDSTNAKITWDEGEDRWMADNGTGTSYGVITAKASEGARYSCVEPTFVTNAYTLSAPTAYENKHAYFLDNGGTAGTLNLFALSGTTYDGYVLQLINKGTNTITVDGDGAQTIGGEATKDISAGATLSLIAYGTAWFII